MGDIDRYIAELEEDIARVELQRDEAEGRLEQAELEIANLRPLADEAERLQDARAQLEEELEAGTY